MPLTPEKEQDFAYQARLFQYAKVKRTDENFNDVTIQVGNETISANRMVLACYSKFFESKCLPTDREQNTLTLNQNGLDGRTVRHVIECIYSGSSSINMGNVEALRHAAISLQVDGVKKMCVEFLETSLTIDNCLTVLENVISCKLSVQESQKTYSYISDNFNKIEPEKINRLTKDAMMSLLKNVHRNKVEEKSLYTAVISWFKHDQTREFSSLFLALQLQRLPFQFVREVAKEPSVKQNNDCLNAVVPYLTRPKNDVEEEREASNIFCVHEIGDTAFVTEVYKFIRKSENNDSNSPKNLFYHNAVKLNDFVFCIGGAVDGNCGNSSSMAYKLNLNGNSEWEKVASMTEKRSCFGAAVFDGYLVVAGGYNGKFRLDTAELYEERFKRWSSIASLTTIRDETVLVVANHKLFAIGGRDDEGHSLASVEQLDSLHGKWTAAKSMKKQRRYFAAVTCDGFIYAIGGQGQGKNVHKSIEKYDASKNKWSLKSSMNTERWKHAACVLDGKIYVVGGRDAKDKPVKTIECYDPSTNKWTEVSEVEQEFSGHALITV